MAFANGVEQGPADIDVDCDERNALLFEIDGSFWQWGLTLWLHELLLALVFTH
mgnify:CR=1 FL=1